MDCNNILEGFISSILAAALIAGIAWGFSWIRNTRLESKLKNAIGPNGVSMGFDQSTHLGVFMVQIHNYANAAIRVRCVVFDTEQFHIELEPDPGRKIYQTPLTNEMMWKYFKRKHLSKGLLEQDNNPHSMLLPAKTMAVWRVHPVDIGKFEWKIKAVYMAFEYATIFGNSALVRVPVRGAAFKTIKDEFERLAISVHNKQPYDFNHHLRNTATSL